MQSDVPGLPESATVCEEARRSDEEFPVNNRFSDGSVKSSFISGENFKLNKDVPEKVSRANAGCNVTYSLF